MHTTWPLSSLKVLTVLLALLFLVSVGWLNYANYLAGSRPWELAVSMLILAVPTGMFFFSIWVLAAAWMQRRANAEISQHLSAFIYWTPRIAGILISLFVALFALDMFDGQSSIWVMIGGFIIHALPALLLAAFIALAWRKPVVGFVGFLFAAVFFLRFSIGQSPMQWMSMGLLFSGPMALIAALFWANWRWNIQRNPAARG